MAYARSLGFERVGVTSAEPFLREEEALRRWNDEGQAGVMTYMERTTDQRARPQALLPQAKSVIALAMNYFPGDPERGSDGKISRYARSRDYHSVIRKRLESFRRYIEALAPDAECRTFVDTGPLLERAAAQRAGLGFVGKNTMLITRGLGSWVFLASVITSLELPLDAPDMRSCGSCRLCIDACPTQAITEPYRLDARRCIAYLTIENRGDIEPPLRERLDGWIFGCDVCQEVCPHNTRVPLSSETGFQKPASDLGLREILEFTEESFTRLLGATPLSRAGRDGLIRNACLAAAHLGRKDLMPQLQALDVDGKSKMIREHARWALSRLNLCRE